MAKLTKEEREFLDKTIAEIEKLQNEIEALIRKNSNTADDRDLYEDEDVFILF